MSEVKVSIIIPVYNPGNLLINCLDSVTHQTLKEIEVLCIDDGSTDDSLEILKKYSENDERFKVFTQRNLGAGIARNVGINNANGEFIIFLDSDDWIEHDMCEVLYNQAKHLDVDLTLFNTIRHLPNNRTRDLIHFDNYLKDYKEFTFDYHFVKDKVMNGYFGVIWCKFYKTSFIKDNEIYFTKHKMFNDVEFHIKTLLLAKKIAYYPRILYHYIMIGQPSLQSSFVGTYDSMCFYDVMVGVKEFLTDYGFMDEFRVEFLDYAFFYFKTKLNQMDVKYKSEYFSKIKKYFESLNLLPSELNKVNNNYVSYYMHIINSEDYAEFDLIHNNFNGENINFNFNDSLKFTNFSDDRFDELTDNKLLINQFYVDILENKLKNLNNEMKFNNNLISKLNKEIADNELLIDELKEKESKFNDLINALRESNKQLDDENAYLKNLTSGFNEELDRLKIDMYVLKNSNILDK